MRPITAKDMVAAIVAVAESADTPKMTLRQAAMAIYTPPFTYHHGYIFDSQRHMVADNGPICDGPNVEGAVASRVRGWGALATCQTPPNCKTRWGR